MLRREILNLASIKTTARKELRSYFLSPVALIFLGVFLVVTLFIFFTYSKFFARNLADVRPLFAWLPVLLIFLVSAVTMRQWSEEQKMGTLEILMTLPLKTSDLVLGKFAAGMALIGLALALTLPLPITVSMLGELDWGPVIGGYVAALLLASTYMAIGLCVSARTDNQIVALMVTALICAVLYLIGAESVAGLVGSGAGEVLRAIGSGSRFDSIERGVLDLRDLFYYGSLTAFFLVLNVHFLEMKRLEKQPAAGASRRPALVLTVALVGLNVAVGNIWLAPVTSARADLTADGEYSISHVTENMLADLQEPLVITGYFSEKTHPLLSPLVPRIRDFLKEYQIRGAGKVTVEIVDPSKDPEVEEEINEQYAIKSVPFRVSDRHEESVVNSYFHILVKYGGEHHVLSFGDLIEVHADDTDVTVRLRNLEYDITGAIKKVTQGFQSIESVMARADASAKITAYITRDSLPAEFKDVPDRIKKVADEIAAKSGGRFTYQEVDPATNPALQDELFQKYRFQPMAVDLFGEDRFYLHLLFQSGDHLERVFPQGEMGEGDIRTAIEAAIRRGTPGFLKTVGIFTEESGPPPMPQFGQMNPPQTDFRALERQLQAEYQVKRVRLEDGVVPPDVDVLLVGKTGNLGEKAQFALDQYLMRGGALVVMAGAYTVKPERTGIAAHAVDDGLLDLLATWGVAVEQAFVMDPQNTAFPVPVQERRGPFVFERVEMMPYPFFPDIRQDGFAKAHVALAGVPSLAMTWASPLKLSKELPEGVTGEVLLQTSEQSWVRTETDMTPQGPQGFPKPDKAESGRQAVAVALTGTFKSHFADKPSPLFKGSGQKPEGENAGEGDATGRTLKTATPDARLVVLGSSEMVSDLVAQIGAQIGGGPYRGNMLLVRNLIDWSLEDTDMLQIRSAGAFARTLKPLKPEERTTYEVANYAVVLLALFGVLGVALTRRRMAKPIPLSPEEAA